MRQLSLSCLGWAKGQREEGKSSAVSANTKCLCRAAVRLHNKPCFVVVAAQSQVSLVSTTLSTAGDHRQHQATFIRVHWVQQMREKHCRKTVFALCLWGHGGRHWCSLAIYLHYFLLTQTAPRVLFRNQIVVLLLLRINTCLIFTSPIPLRLGYVFFNVCYLAGLHKNYWTDYHGTLWKNVGGVREVSIQFSYRSGSKSFNQSK